MSYRMLSLCSAVLAVLPCFSSPLSAEESTQEGLVTVILPDFQATRERVNAGPLGTLWRSPLMADAREAYGEVQGDILNETGVDIDGVLSDFTRGMLRFDGVSPMQEPLFSARGQFGSAIDSIWQLLAAEHQAMDAIFGADQALQTDLEEGYFLRFGDQIAVYSQGSSPLDFPAETVATDLHVSLDIAKLMALAQPLLAMMPADEQQRLQVAIEMMVAISMRTDFLADGVREQLMITFAEGDFDQLELPVVDMATIDRMPADSLMALAIAINMQANQGTPFALSRDELRQQVIDMTIFTPFAGMMDPLADPIADFLYAMNGTVVVAVLPSVPFPAMAIAIPRNDQLAAALETLIPLIGITLPAVGELTSIPAIPMLPLTLAHGEHGILLTSHPTFASEWLAGEGGGALNGDAARVALAALSEGGSVSALGFSDTQRVLEVLQGLAPLAAASPLPIDIGDIMDTLDSLQSSAGSGYMLSEVVGREQRQELKSLFGFVSTAVMGTIPFRLMIVGRMQHNFDDDIDDWDEWADE